MVQEMNKQLLQHQISTELERYRPLMKFARPTVGWIKIIRQAFGMTMTQLASRMQITQSSFARLEEAEAEYRITLKSLRNAAKAMDCELVYVLLPKQKIEDIIRKQAKKFARKRLDEVSHHMALENQSLSDEQLQQVYEDLLYEILKNPPKNFWNIDEN